MERAIHGCLPVATACFAELPRQGRFMDGGYRSTQFMYRVWLALRGADVHQWRRRQRGGGGGGIAGGDGGGGGGGGGGGDDGGGRSNNGGSVEVPEAITRTSHVLRAHVDHAWTYPAQRWLPDALAAIETVKKKKKSVVVTGARAVPARPAAQRVPTAVRCIVVGKPPWAARRTWTPTRVTTCGG